MRRIRTVSPTDLETALGNTEQLARAADQAVINALFNPITAVAPDGIVLNRAPLRGIPFLTLLTDSLTGLSRRIDVLAAFHDFACDLRDCSADPVNGTLPLLTRALGHLEEGLNPDLHAAMHAAEGADATKWLPLILWIHDHRGLLTDAVKTALGPHALTDPGTAVNGSLFGPASMLRRARDRALTFEATGRFEGSRGNAPCHAYRRRHASLVFSCTAGHQAPPNRPRSRGCPEAPH